MNSNKKMLKIKKYLSAVLAAVCIVVLIGCSSSNGAASASPLQSAEGALPSASQDVTAAAELPEASAAKTPTAEPSPSVAASASPSAEPSKIPENETNAGPLDGVVIGLDPGHQAHGNSEPEPVAPGSSETKPKVSSGTAGVASGVDEHVVNLNVALKLRDMLKEAGAKVVMTRTTADVDISNVERAQLFNEKKVDLGIRIHCNGIDDSSVRGAFMLIPESNPYEDDCKLAAKLIIKNYTETTGIKKLETQVRSDQTGFNWSERPIVNIEMGHMSNPDEDLLITDKDFQTTMAEGIYKGIVEYFKEKE
jgi:N-acetylmuramoyl-L-alanine amidase